LKKVQHLKEIGMEVWSLDVTSKEFINKTVAKVRELTGGTLDFLVNNAGVGQYWSLFPIPRAVVADIYAKAMKCPY
jgi:1-acylglycerone phosphate reductase